MTLSGWVADLKYELARQNKQATIVPIDWKPGQPRPSSETTSPGSSQRVVKLFAFGMEKARTQIREEFGMDWNDDTHIFVA